jgi:redox-sensing transcriptional repressor
MNRAVLSGQSVPKPTLQRLPGYLNYLRDKRREGAEYISASAMAMDMGLNPVQVRKDLSAVSASGRPKTGFSLGTLIADLEEFLGYNNARDAVLVGVGQLGRTLLSYGGFSNYGLNLIAAFDVHPALLEDGREVYPMEQLGSLCRRLKVRLGIITVPAQAAQAVCDQLVASGIMAIWNFAPVHLSAPDDVIVQNEDIAASLAVLSTRLEERLSAS